MVLIVFALCALNFLWGEKTFIRHGLGWDGEYYGMVAKDFGGYVFGRQVDAYRLQRLLPTAVVHYGLRLVALEPTDARIIAGFQLLNATMLLLAALIWVRIARVVRLGTRATWFGFIALFVNYAVLKQAFFVSVTTDPSAFALGMLVVWLFLTGRQGPLLVVALVGAFVWPTVSLSVAFLLLFPRRGGAPPAAEDWRFAAAAGAALAAGMLALLGYLYLRNGRRSAGMGPVVPIIEEVVLLSALLFGVYILLAVSTLLKGIGPLYAFRALRAIRPANLALAAVASIVPRVIVNALADPTAPQLLTGRTFLGFLAIMPVTRPLIFLVSHVIYLGPAVLLVVLLWRSLADDVRWLGPGAVAFFLLAIVITFTPESRQSIFTYPFFIALLAPHVQSFADDRTALTGFLALSLVLSKFWLPIHAYLPEGRETDLGLPLHFMNHGPWMQNPAYLVHLLVFAASALIIWRLWRRSAASGSRDSVTTSPLRPAGIP